MLLFKITMRCNVSTSANEIVYLYTVIFILAKNVTQAIDKFTQQNKYSNNKYPGDIVEIEYVKGNTEYIRNLVQV